MKKLKKNSNGFTLLELLLAVAITALLISGVFGMVRPINNSLRNTKIINEQRNICRSVTNYIEESLRFCNENVFIVANTSGQPICTGEFANYSVIHISKENITVNGKTVHGRLYKKEKASDLSETPAISLATYSDYSLNFAITASGSPVSDVKTKLYLYKIRNGAIVEDLTTESTVRLKNFVNNSKDISCTNCFGKTTQNTIVTGITAQTSGTETYIIYKKNTDKGFIRG